MRIRWVKVAAGIYVTDTGRWRAEKNDNGGWYVLDSADKYPYLPVFYGNSLREVKQLVDDQLEFEQIEATE